MGSVAEEVTVTFGSTVATNARFTTDGNCPYDFYAATSDQWRMSLNGNAHVVDLDTDFLGQLISGKVDFTGGVLVANIVTGTNDEINFTIDGVDYSVTLATGIPNPTTANILTDINAVLGVNGTAATVAIGTDNIFYVESAVASSGLPDAFDELATGFAPGGYTSSPRPERTVPLSRTAPTSAAKTSTSSRRKPSSNDSGSSAPGRSRTRR